MLLFISHWRSHCLGNRVAFCRRNPREEKKKSKQMIISIMAFPCQAERLLLLFFSTFSCFVWAPPTGTD